MAVRGFEEADFAAVCAIYVDAKRDELAFEGRHFDITPLDQDPVILAAFRESDVRVFTSQADVVVAFAATCGKQLRALFVREDARGKGVGRALVRAVTDGESGLVLNVARSNVKARRFSVYKEWNNGIELRKGKNFRGWLLLMQVLFPVALFPGFMRSVVNNFYGYRYRQFVTIDASEPKVTMV